MRITLAMAKAAVAELPNVNLCANDGDRLKSLVNQAIELIVEESKSDLLARRIRFCITNACVTTPRGVASITDAALCDSAIPVKNQWYEFLPNGTGVYVGQDEGGGCNSGVRLEYRGEVVTHTDITGNDKQLKFYTDVQEDPSTYLWVYGRNQYGQIIRTEQDGILKDGERIDLGSGPGPFTTANIFGAGAIANIHNAATKGGVRLYSVSTTDASEIALATYEHNETNPSYRRYLVRGFDCSGGSCGSQTLTAMVKLEYIPAEDDNDVLLVESMEAIRKMASSVIKGRNNELQESAVLSKMAMARMALTRDNVSPKEQISVRIQAHGSAKLANRGIGTIR